jgi:hypothetical protein
LKEPTYVLFFGDHLGVLGKNYGAYRDSGFLSSSDESEWTEAERLSLYSPPFAVWNNFEQIDAQMKPVKKDFGHVRAPFFGNLLLDTLGAEKKDPRFNFLSSVADCFQKTTADFVEAENCGGTLRNFAIFQYFVLFGEYFETKGP